MPYIPYNDEQKHLANSVERGPAHVFTNATKISIYEIVLISRMILTFLLAALLYFLSYHDVL